MSYSYQFHLNIIKLVTEQDYGIREVAKLHKISYALVIYWLKAFRGRRGFQGRFRDWSITARDGGNTCRWCGFG